MYLTTALTAACLASTGMALPFSLPSLWRRQEEEKKCMTPDEVEELVKAYSELIEVFSPEMADRWMADEFFDTSQSINTFIHLPYDGPTFPTKEKFIEKQTVGAHFPVNVLSVDVVSCDRIALQWDSTFGAAQLPAKGLTILKNVFQKGVWKMASIEVEFNSLFWLLNMGGSYTWEGKTYTADSPDPATIPAAKPGDDDPEEEAPEEDAPEEEEPEEEEPEEEEPEEEEPEEEEPEEEEPEEEIPEPEIEVPEEEAPEEEEAPMRGGGPSMDSPIVLDPPISHGEDK